MPKISYMIDERPLRIIFFSRELCPYFMDFSKKEKKYTQRKTPLFIATHYILLVILKLWVMGVC